MNKFLGLLVMALVLFGARQEYIKSTANAPAVVNRPSNQQARTSHRIAMYTEQEVKQGACTGTAIAYHAILTARHCIDSDTESIRIDLARRQYHIYKEIKDENEHIILLIDGPKLTDVQPYKHRMPKVGEHEFFYGFGGGDYPAHCASGVVLDEFDPSEANVVEGVSYHSAESIPGDSGSAVYADDGSILTLVSMHMDYSTLFTTKIIMVGYDLRFTEDQIKLAQAYEHVADK